MPKTRYLLDLHHARRLDGAGSKAVHLHLLIKEGMRVPRAVVVLWTAYARYRSGDLSVLTDLDAELKRLLVEDARYAVRSSANIEDGRRWSGAGQFVSILDVCGWKALLAAIRSVWDSAQSQRVYAYHEKLEPAVDQPASSLAERVRIAVIIQEMVQPIAAGVAFSCNPVTALDEVVIEAVPGSGTVLVQEGATPLRWVNKWGVWREQPQSSPIPIEVVAQVAADTKRLAARLGKQVDLEWAYDGRQLSWLQMREITALEDIRIYTNKLAKEMIPGQIKPLLYATIIPMKVRHVTRMLEAMSGQQLANPGAVIRTFGYRIYFETMAFGRIFAGLGLPRDALEIMFGLHPAPPERPLMRMQPQMLRQLPRAAKLVWQEWRFAGRQERQLPLLRQQYTALAEQPLGALDERALLGLTEQLDGLHAETIHINVTVPIAMYVCSRMLGRYLRRWDVNFGHFDLTGNLPALASYQPNVPLAALHQQFQAFAEPVRAEILDGGYAGLGQIAAAVPFKAELDRFLVNFGHFSDNGNDFTCPRWSETPDLILQLLAQFQPPAGSGSVKLRPADLPWRCRHDPMFQALYAHTRTYLVLRERASSLYTFSVGLYRRIFLALGSRLRARGVLASPDDIFYLYATELRAIADGTAGEQDWASLVAARREEMESWRDIPLPPVIYGDELPPIAVQDQRKLVGTPTGRGCYTGRAKVVRGLGEFRKVEPGDVLVIPRSDVGWAPLFVKAGAVVAESGGMLSHSAIVAREYGIPAVVSVQGALDLRDGTLLTVDGNAGEILIHEE